MWKQVNVICRGDDDDDDDDGATHWALLFVKQFVNLLVDVSPQGHHAHTLQYSSTADDTSFVLENVKLNWKYTRTLIRL